MERPIKKRIYLRNILLCGESMRAMPKELTKILVKDMAEKGLLNPILCCAKNRKSKRVAIADGYIRLKAYKILNSRKPKSRRRKTIDVLLMFDSNIFDVRLSQVIK